MSPSDSTKPALNDQTSSASSGTSGSSSNSSNPSPVTEVSEPFVRDALVWLAYLLIGIYCYIIAAFGPVMPMLAGELHFSYTMTAYHFSAYALGVLVAGSTGDRVMAFCGRNRVIWGGSLCMLLGTVLIICSRDAVFTIFGAWLIGCTGSIMGQANTTIMADRFKDHRAQAITEINIAGSLFCSMAPLMVSLCVRMGLGWRAVFAMPIILFVVLYARWRNVASAYQKSTAHAAAGQKLPMVYWAFWTVILLSVAGEWSIVFWATDFMMHVNNFSKADASACVSVFLVAMLLGRVIGSRLSRFMHVRTLLQSSSILGLLGFLIFWLSKHPLLNLAGLFIAGIGQSNVYPLTFASAIGVGAKQTSSATSRLSLASGTANLCTPMLMGYIADRSGISCAYGVVAVLWTLVIVLVFVANRLALRLQPQA